VIVGDDQLRRPRIHSSISLYGACNFRLANEAITPIRMLHYSPPWFVAIVINVWSLHWAFQNPLRLVDKSRWLHASPSCAAPRSCLKGLLALPLPPIVFFNHIRHIKNSYRRSLMTLHCRDLGLRNSYCLSDAEQIRPTPAPRHLPHYRSFRSHFLSRRRSRGTMLAF
jgi:hypothetical protein